MLERKQAMMTPSATLQKVLVIDDEFGPRESLRMLLKDKYEILCADSAAEGLKLLKENKPDLVILDIRMPKMDGIEALRKIREIDPHVSLIMLTGFGALQTAQEALRLGANDYLKKPFDSREMLEVVERNLKRTQVARRRYQTLYELNKLNNQLMNELAEKERMASLGQASAEFVHDLQNPLAVVVGYSQMLFKKMEMFENMPSVSLQETLHYLDAIEKNAKRCCELAEVWQNLSKKDPTSRMKPISLVKILREIVKATESAAESTEVQVKLEVEKEDYKIFADDIQLFRAIQNVVMNAIQSITGKNGIVHMICSQKGDDIEIRVEDNGCGMSVEELHRIFEPYFTTKAPHKGTGLGLFITRKVVEAHGGSIDIESVAQKGTTVRIRLPLHQKQAVQPNASSAQTLSSKLG